jgi:hypothetical protein
MENKGYTIIQDWMLDLPLSLVETMAYAVIFGFSQDGESMFEGSLAYLARKCKVTRDTARAALRKLADKGLIEKGIVKKNGVEYHRYRVISVGGGNFQGGIEIFNEGGRNFQPNNKDNNIDIKNISNKGRFDFFKSLLQLGVSEQTARDWMEVRKAKRAANTETAFRNIATEIRKSGMDAESCIRMSAANSWQGFKAEWAQNRQKPAPVPASRQESAYEHNQRLMRELLGDFNPMGGQVDEQ